MDAPANKDPIDELHFAAVSSLPVKPDASVLEGRFVRLVPLEVAHFPRIVPAFTGASYAGHPAYDATQLVWRYMRGGVQSPTSLPSDITYAYDKQLALADARVFVVEDVASAAESGGDCLVAGTTAYLASRPADLVIEIGCVTFTPAYQGTPCNTEATYLLLKHAFELGYRRVEWKCDAANARSKAAALRMGFTYEGTFRRHMIVKGLNRDTAWFSVIEEDWPGVREKLEAWLASSDAAALMRKRKQQLRDMCMAVTS